MNDGKKLANRSLRVLTRCEGADVWEESWETRNKPGKYSHENANTVIINSGPRHCIKSRRKMQSYRDEFWDEFPFRGSSNNTIYVCYCNTWISVSLHKLWGCYVITVMNLSVQKWLSPSAHHSHMNGWNPKSQVPLLNIWYPVATACVIAFNSTCHPYSSS